MKDKGKGPCQSFGPDLTMASLRETSSDSLLQTFWRTAKVYLLYTKNVGPIESIRISLAPLGLDKSRIPPIRMLGRLAVKRRGKTSGAIGKGEDLNLQPGEWVQVRSAQEILATLDGRNKLQGLTFTPEMLKYCGKKFRVFKKVQRIRLETGGGLRKLRAPTVLLEGVFCDGEFHGGCDRSCFCYWREAWLERVSS